MKLVYKYLGTKYSVDKILEFQGEEQAAFWSEPLFHFYPQINKELFKTLAFGDRREYLSEVLDEISAENELIIHEKINKYNERWRQYQGQIVDALQEAFEIELDDKFNNMEGYISFNPISPRYLESNSFDVFYLSSEKGALGLALHEIIHFVWFYVWNQHFHDYYEDYERPHLKWILSEMVVEPIMRDERLKSINPYFDGGGCVYPYFYTLKIEDKPILDILYDMYKSITIIEFMEKGYNLCLKYETEIREHIAKNEQGLIEF